MSFYEKLQALNIELPAVATPAAAYVMYAQTGNTVFLSGHIAKKDGKPMTPIWITTIFFTLVTAFIISALFNSLIVTSIGGMFLIALCVWIGFVVPVKLSDYLFGGDSFTFMLLSVGHELVVIIIMSLIIGIWG